MKSSAELLEEKRLKDVLEQKQARKAQLESEYQQLRAFGTVLVELVNTERRLQVDGEHLPTREILIDQLVETENSVSKAVIQLARLLRSIGA